MFIIVLLYYYLSCYFFYCSCWYNFILNIGTWIYIDRDLNCQDYRDVAGMGLKCYTSDLELYSYISMYKKLLFDWLGKKDVFFMCMYGFFLFRNIYLFMILILTYYYNCSNNKESNLLIYKVFLNLIFFKKFLLKNHNI